MEPGVADDYAAEVRQVQPVGELLGEDGPSSGGDRVPSEELAGGRDDPGHSSPRQLRLGDRRRLLPRRNGHVFRDFEGFPGKYNELLRKENENVNKETRFCNLIIFLFLRFVCFCDFSVFFLFFFFFFVFAFSEFEQENRQWHILDFCLL